MYKNIHNRVRDFLLSLKTEEGYWKFSDISNIWGISSIHMRVGRSSAGYRLDKFTYVNNPVVMQEYAGPFFRKTKKKELVFDGCYGVFRASLSGKSGVNEGYISHYRTGLNGASTTIAFGNDDFYKALILFCEGASVRFMKPKPGIYNLRLISTPMGQRLIYEKMDQMPFSGNIIHPSINAIKTEVGNFFGNLESFSRFGQSPTRKIVIIGPPGTGKTGTNFNIAKEYSKTHSVVFSSNIGAVYQHMADCGKYSVPTIIIMDDAEELFENPSSDLLNLLSGHNSIKQNSGVFIIFTTNRPESIEDRVLKRPGRIDWIYEMGYLTGEYALKCARMYFDGLCLIPDGTTTFDNMTGAEIQELSHSSKLYAISKGKELTLEVVEIVKQQMHDNLKKAENYGVQDRIMGSTYRNRRSVAKQEVGFRINN